MITKYNFGRVFSRQELFLCVFSHLAMGECTRPLLFSCFGCFYLLLPVMFYVFQGSEIGARHSTGLSRRNDIPNVRAEGGKHVLQRSHRRSPEASRLQRPREISYMTTMMAMPKVVPSAWQGCGRSVYGFCVLYGAVDRCSRKETWSLFSLLFLLLFPPALPLHHPAVVHCSRDQSCVLQIQASDGRLPRTKGTEEMRCV